MGLSILFPSHCTLENINKFCTELSQAAKQEKVTIDFINMSKINPFDMLFVSNAIKEFTLNNPELDLKFKNYKSHTYAAHMSFFKAFGLDYGNSIDTKSQSSTYLAISKIRTKKLTELADQNWSTENDVLEEEARKLAELLTQQKSTDLVDLLAYSLREIMRNVVEHSESKAIYYCAQYWPSLSKVEIAILDSGIGLKNSLIKNPYIQLNTDIDAINLALMPSVSSKNYKGAPVDTSDPWHNSGFGLFMTSRLCQEEGEYFICSGKGGLLLRNKQKTKFELYNNFKGTAVKMVLNTSSLGSLSEKLNELSKEGKKLAKHIKNAGNVEASAASQMLSRDFKDVNQ